MSRVFWDTNLFIYLFEDHPEFSKPTIELRLRMLERRDELVTSVMTLGEIQVKPRREGDYALAASYRDVIKQSSTVAPFSEAAANIYAELREKPGIKSPDAIQLSCAAAAGVELFITNDVSLHRLAVPGIHFVTSLMRVPI
jgi:predicted nucleic acid-binding protein